MKYWLMKSEPGSYSIDDLKREGASGWDGVRNYQARNFMRDDMKVGDLVLFYHSNSNPPGVAGMGRVSQTGIVDHTAFDPMSQYYDPKSSKENPRWIMVEVEFLEKFKTYVSLEDLKQVRSLSEMRLLQKGNRLSIMPVSKPHFRKIAEMAASRSKLT
ncbi:MAG: hypothetical protein K940chlam3_00967 [Chlamydiae bacterium]|nr:hypothetical protein [Chlamydiota bacterium]